MNKNQLSETKSQHKNIITKMDVLNNKKVELPVEVFAELIQPLVEAESMSLKEAIDYVLEYAENTLPNTSESVEDEVKYLKTRNAISKVRGFADIL